MKILPPTLPACRVPPIFSPSHVAIADACPLRAVLGSEVGIPALAANPAAAIGRAFHKLLELAIRGEINRSSTGSSDIEFALDRLLAAEETLLSRDWSGPAPALRAIYPPVVWRRKRRAIIDLAKRYQGGELAGAARKRSAGALRAPELPEAGQWAEVKMESLALRLVGRADVVERKDGRVTIRDLKTGRILSSAGVVAPHIELQMRLYGLIARQIWRASQIELIVDDGSDHLVPFSADDEASTLSWLHGLLARLAPGSAQPAEDLATIGAACEGCPFRHVCPAYRRAAPAFWHAGGPVRMPLDTWGEIVAITRRADDLNDVTLTDEANRTVKIFGLISARVAGLCTGDYLWLFGLHTNDPRRRPEGWCHPRNFFEVPDGDPFRRAWSLDSYSGASCLHP